MNIFYTSNTFAAAWIHLVHTIWFCSTFKNTITWNDGVSVPWGLICEVIYNKAKAETDHNCDRLCLQNYRQQWETNTTIRACMFIFIYMLTRVRPRSRAGTVKAPEKTEYIKLSEVTCRNTQTKDSPVSDSRGRPPVPESHHVSDRERDRCQDHNSIISSCSHSGRIGLDMS